MENNNVVLQALNEIAGAYTVVIDSVCPVHGGRNFSYRNKDENFDRQESICEGCTSPARQPAPSPEVQAARSARSHERPARPSKR